MADRANKLLGDNIRSKGTRNAVIGAIILEDKTRITISPRHARNTLREAKLEAQGGRACPEKEVTAMSDKMVCEADWCECH